MGRRGSKVVSDRDWLFGSRPRRLALEALLAAGPGRTWSKTDLARAAEVSPNGGIDEHVAGFVRIGLLARRGPAFVLAHPAPPFVAGLRELLGQLTALPEQPVLDQTGRASGRGQ